MLQIMPCVFIYFLKKKIEHAHTVSSQTVNTVLPKPTVVVLLVFIVAHAGVLSAAFNPRTEWESIPIYFQNLHINPYHWMGGHRSAVLQPPPSLSPPTSHNTRHIQFLPKHSSFILKRKWNGLLLREPNPFNG